MTTRTKGGGNRKVANNSLYRVSSGRVEDGLKSFTSEDERKKTGGKYNPVYNGVFLGLKIHLWIVQRQEFLIKNTS